jgi:hypothetical protein
MKHPCKTMCWWDNRKGDKKGGHGTGRSPCRGGRVAAETTVCTCLHSVRNRFDCVPTPSVLNRRHDVQNRVFEQR